MRILHSYFIMYTVFLSISVWSMELEDLPEGTEPRNLKVSQPIPIPQNNRRQNHNWLRPPTPPRRTTNTPSSASHSPQSTYSPLTFNDYSPTDPLALTFLTASLHLSQETPKESSDDGYYSK